MPVSGPDYEAEAGVQRAQVSAESFLQNEKLPVFNLGSGGFKVSYDFDLFACAGPARRPMPTPRPPPPRSTWRASAWPRRWPAAIWTSATPTMP